jgi:hypothetical protein
LSNKILKKNLKREKLDVDSIFNISYDHQNGEILAMTADNYCFLWDSVNSKMKAKFLLQSPGINICWHKDEKSKVLKFFFLTIHFNLF